MKNKIEVSFQIGIYRVVIEGKDAEKIVKDVGKLQDGLTPCQRIQTGEARYGNS